MRIGFDATAMFGPGSKNRGIGNYSVSLFRTLIGSDKENEYYLLNCMDGTEFRPCLGESLPNYHEEILYSGRNYTFFKREFSEIYGDIVRTFIEKNKIDVFIITSPFEYETCIYKREWFQGVKLYCIVYDIIPYIMKKDYLTTKNAMAVYMKCVDTMRSCDRLLTISESVRNDLVSYLGFDRKKIDVILGAYDGHFRKTEISEDEKSALYGRFGLSDGFIMCTGGDDVRKNIGGLIEAYAAVPNDLRDEHQLVVVCKLSKESERRYFALADKLGVRDRVILTNFVSTEDLISLYNLAYLMAFPSKYEGFGLPVVEAWACGTPVLTSNNSSLGEVAGDAAVLVDPYRTESITAGLTEALTTADLDAMLARGRERLEKFFNWEHVASLAHASLMKARPADATADPVSAGKRRIAMFTPLPPIRSGISDYSVDVIRALSEYFDIDVFVDDGYMPNVVLGDNVSVYHHKKYPAMHVRYADTVYQMGNSEFHLYMYNYIEKFSGTVVLHDYSMNDIAAYTNAKGKHRLYSKFVSSDYPGSEADMIMRYGLSFETPLNGIVVNPASRVIVHDPYSKKRLIRRNFGKNVYVIPHYAKPEKPVSDTRELRKRYGYSEKDVIIAAFGIIAESKRILPLTEAFISAAKNNDSLKLLLVGNPDSLIDAQLYGLINESGISDRIRITGYTELSEFSEYMDISDFCFNLRYPYRGESSGSLARLLAKGKPVVVNRIGSFDSVPDDACIKINDVADMNGNEEVETILALIENFVESPGTYSDVASNAKSYAERELDLSEVAKRYRDVINAPVRCAITRELSDEILRILDADGYTRADRIALAHTFAYSRQALPGNDAIG